MCSTLHLSSISMGCVARETRRQTADQNTVTALRAPHFSYEGIALGNRLAKKQRSVAAWACGIDVRIEQHRSDQLRMLQCIGLRGPASPIQQHHPSVGFAPAVGFGATLILHILTRCSAFLLPPLIPGSAFLTYTIVSLESALTDGVSLGVRVRHVIHIHFII